MVTWILKMAHDKQFYGSHLGVKKTIMKLKDFWWPKMRSTVEHYIKTCHLCQLHKKPPGKPLGCMKPLRSSELFERIHIDFSGPKPVTHRGNLYIVAIVDAFSKFSFTRAIKEQTTEAALDLLMDEIIPIHGPPKCIYSDRGNQLTSTLMAKVTDLFNIKRQTTAGYPSSR